MKLKIMSQKNGNLVRFAILNKKPIKHKNLCVFICYLQKNRQKNHLVPLPAIKIILFVCYNAIDHMHCPIGYLRKLFVVRNNDKGLPKTVA